MVHGYWLLAAATLSAWHPASQTAAAVNRHRHRYTAGIDKASIGSRSRNENARQVPLYFSLPRPPYCIDGTRLHSRIGGGAETVGIMDPI
eukprot:scaffold122904_cov30-Tisochrysis_lutea.AAC.1